MKSLHSNKISIHGIEDQNAKNILRGIINESETYKIENALKRIKQKCSNFIYKQSLELIRGDHLFEKNIFTRDFCKVCPSYLNTKVLSYSLDEIIEKINFNEEKLIGLIDIYKSVLINIKDKEFNSALKSCSLIIDNGGVSCFLVRVIFFIANHTESDSNEKLQVKIDHILNKIQLTNVGYLETAIRELSNTRTDYFNICNKINSNNSKSSIQNITKSFISHVVKTEAQFLVTLSSYYSFSLIDAYLYHQNSIRLKLPYVKDNINLALVKSYEDLTTVKLGSEFHFTEYDDYLDTSFFRGCFLLIELNDFFIYKTIHAALYNKNELKLEERLPIENELLSNYFENIKSIDHLRTDESEYVEINICKFDVSHCNNLENSNALNYILEKNDADIVGFENKFVKLMSTTMDIGYTCSLQYLQKIDIKAKSNELKLVIACLISIKDTSQASEHRLRKIIQEIVISDYGSDLTILVEKLYSISPSVTLHLINTCDETFLSKLFHIIAKPNDAIENRAKMLEWYGKLINESAYIDRAKNLRIDVQINKEKQAIDDHRIYVDPIKFSQWINDNILDDLTLLLEVAISNSEMKLININWEKAQYGLQNNEQIAAYLQKCYEEFCNNELFGIASYLGRRIRHGTFKGTGLKEVQDLCEKPKYKGIFEHREFSDYYDKWILSYEEMLDNLKTSYLHIKGKKKPLGMINSEINTKKKQTIAGHFLFEEIINSYIKHDSTIEIPALITEACWLFIEEDLSSIRKLLMESKSKYAVFDFTGKSDCINKRSEAFSGFSQELNSLSADKFRTISSWFNKPSIASPSANLALLFKAVLSEIKGYFTEYTPEVISDGQDLTISGGVYFILYDALYILIYNAAKYGKKTGVLELQITLDEENKLMNISISSDPKENDSKCIKAKDLINKALNEDFRNANVYEGRSGIKKLNSMKEDKLINDVVFKFNNNRVTASFTFDLDF